MSDSRSAAHRLALLVGLAVIAVLAASLVLRVRAYAADSAPRAAVPSPIVSAESTPDIPAWSTPLAANWALRFRTDLDLLAPLGDGDGNAAVWFKDFRKPAGRRFQEATAANERRLVHERLGKYLPADDPLLLEAEPWIDQATMQYYPELLLPSGYSTEIPNLLFALTLARSWAVRGTEATDAAVAMQDFRRVIRLGRLLRQEDAVMISDLVGLACIRIGAEMIYERASADGDDDLALIAAIVVGEAAPQRLLTLQRLSESDLGGYLRRDAVGGYQLELPDPLLDLVLDRAENAPDRRFRIEAILALNIAYGLGTADQQERIGPVLDRLAASADEIVADSARYARDTPPNEEYLAEYSHPPWK